MNFKFVCLVQITTSLYYDHYVQLLDISFDRPRTILTARVGTVPYALGPRLQKDEDFYSSVSTTTEVFRIHQKQT